MVQYDLMDIKLVVRQGILLEIQTLPCYSVLYKFNFYISLILSTLNGCNPKNKDSWQR